MGLPRTFPLSVTASARPRTTGTAIVTTVQITLLTAARITTSSLTMAA